MVEKTTKDDTIRRFILNVDKIVNKWVPNTVPGEDNFRLMIEYQSLKELLISHYFPSIEPKRTKWRQMDLEEAIKNEKDGKSLIPNKGGKD